MNGPEHYQEAERILGMDAHLYGALYALTHAVLALVAANAENDATEGRTEAEIHRWVGAGAIEAYGTVNGYGGPL